VFRVLAGDRELFRSAVMRSKEDPESIDLEVGGAKELDLYVDDGGDGSACDLADWAEAKITLKDGTTLWLDTLVQLPGTRRLTSRYPFSFVYDGRHSNEFLSKWTQKEQTEKLDANRTQILRTWHDPETGLIVEWRIVRFADFPAAEWVLRFRNKGTKDTIRRANHPYRNIDKAGGQARNIE